jgi:hypothetical protein
MKRFAIYYTEGNHPDEFRELVISSNSLADSPQCLSGAGGFFCVLWFLTVSVLGVGGCLLEGGC